ncbi:MAG: GxxExxY protein [Agriterribacter sp.]
MKTTQKEVNELSYVIIGCAIEVHKHLGPGLLESVYEKCFIEELKIRKLRYRAQEWIPVTYKDIKLDTNLKLDVLEEDIIIVELKAIEALAPIHDAQLLTYMKLLEKPKGILINFNCTNIFREGQKTLVNALFSDLPFC